MTDLLGLYIKHTSYNECVIDKFIEFVKKYNEKYKNDDELYFIQERLTNFFRNENEDSIFVFYLDRKNIYDVYDVYDLDAKIIMTHPKFENFDEIDDDLFYTNMVCVESKLYNYVSTNTLGNKY